MDKQNKKQYKKIIMILLVYLFLILFYGCKKIDNNVSYSSESNSDSTLNNANKQKTKSHFGFVIDNSNNQLYDIDGIKDLGIKLIKLYPGPFIWGSIENQKKVFDYEETDNIIKIFQENNISLVATIWPYNDLDQSTCNPPFCIPNNNVLNGILPDSRCKPCDMNDYLTFINILVDRYDGDGHNDMDGLKIPIQDWEIMSQPDSESLGLFIGSPLDYLNIQIFSYEVIKKADPKSNILHASLKFSNESNGFFDEIFNRGLYKYFDTANLHSINGPDDFYSRDFNLLLKQNNISKPFWITDVRINESGKDQALKLFKGYIQSFSNGADVIFYGTYIDDESGIVYENNTKKESYYALKTLVKKIGSFSNIEVIGGIYKFSVYDKNDVKAIYVTWNKIPKNIIKDWNTYLITTYSGQEKMVSSNDVLKMEINEPIFIEVVY